jgi:hypothetical protein
MHDHPNNASVKPTRTTTETRRLLVPSSSRKGATARSSDEQDQRRGIRVRDYGTVEHISNVGSIEADDTALQIHIMSQTRAVHVKIQAMSPASNAVMKIFWVAHRPLRRQERNATAKRE